MSKDVAWLALVTFEKPDGVIKDRFLLAILKRERHPLTMLILSILTLATYMLWKERQAFILEVKFIEGYIVTTPSS